MTDKELQELISLLGTAIQAEEVFTESEREWFKRGREAALSAWRFPQEVPSP